MSAQRLRCIFSQSLALTPWSALDPLSYGGRLLPPYVEPLILLIESLAITLDYTRTCRVSDHIIVLGAATENTPI